MAGTGVIMLAFLVVHMLGNLKIFFGAAEFNHYAGWLRTIGSPAVPSSGFLWVQRLVLVGAVVAHGIAAYQLSRRDVSARPSKYQHRPPARASYATRTMRWGGVILGLFIVWHILDLTTLTINPLGAGAPPVRERRRRLPRAGTSTSSTSSPCSPWDSTYGTVSGVPRRPSAPTTVPATAA